MRYEFNWYNKDELCSVIIVDEAKRKVQVEDYTDNIFHKVFGIQKPSWELYQWLLEDRVVPKTRDNLKKYLEQINVDGWDPIKIIKVTEGEMAEDTYRLVLVREW